MKLFFITNLLISQVAQKKKFPAILEADKVLFATKQANRNLKSYNRSQSSSSLSVFVYETIILTLMLPLLRVKTVELLRDKLSPDNDKMLHCCGFVSVNVNLGLKI